MSVTSVYSAAEPMLNERMGRFKDLHIPVAGTNSPANWSLSPGDQEYLVPQTQEEHDRLLNTFYAARAQYPDWKERGQEVESQSKHYTDKDAVPRKNLRARSSVIQDMAYDKERNLAMLMMGGKWYTYSATPEQFQHFLMSGSLGREMNNIKHDRGTTLMKTAARKPRPFFLPETTGWAAPKKAGIMSRIARLFGF